MSNWKWEIKLVLLHENQIILEVEKNYLQSVDEYKGCASMIVCKMG